MSIFKKPAKIFNEKSAAPKAPRDNSADIYHGTRVEDPYRPLEDLNHPKTTEFVKAHNRRFADFIGDTPEQKQMEDFLNDIWNYESESLPTRYGQKYFSSYKDGKSNQSVYRVREGLEGAPRVLIDPNQLNTKGTTSLSGTFPSPTGKYLAYLLSEDGSDAKTLHIMDVKTGKNLPDVVENCRFTSVRWDKNETGFNYSYPADKEPRRHVVKHHILGQDVKTDRLVFDPKIENSFGHVGRLEGGYEYASVGIGSKASNAIYLKAPGGDFQPFLADEDFSYSPVGIINGKLYVVTDRDAPRSRLVSIDLKNPAPENWKTVIAEDKNNVLNWVHLKGDQFMVSWTEDTASKITFHKHDGSHIQTMPLPPQSVAGFGSVNKKDKEILVSVSGFRSPGDQYKYDVEKNTLTLWRKSKAKVDLGDAVIERVFATSKDGTKVPMTVIRRKDVTLDGSAAVKLYGYGGFNVSLNPGFSFAVYNWVKEGGVYVQANLRGGGEFGADWYNNGRLLKKQNVFDDFIACAEHLIAKNYTKPERLSIDGGSNGGLLTLATMLQRPELFGAVLSGVPVTDMYRFHKFTWGAAWKSDYGDIESVKADFNAAAAYSPLHNIKPGIAYPPVLVSTADGDDRVVPSHSYKFIATFNEIAPQSLGLLSVTMNAGHGAGMSKTQYIRGMVEEHAFLVKTLGPIDQNAYKAAVKAYESRRPKVKIRAGRKK